MAFVAVTMLALLLSFPVLVGASPLRCDPAGIWYGGSDWKYLATISPEGPDGSYLVSFQTAFETTVRFGVPKLTTFEGRMVRRGNRTFEQRSVSMNELPSDDPSAAPPVELDVVHGILTFKEGCDIFENVIDVYGGYVPITDAKVPFVTPVDVDALGGGVVRETYRRVKPLK
jgi:hypothetical protein